MRPLTPKELVEFAYSFAYITKMHGQQFIQLVNEDLLHQGTNFEVKLLEADLQGKYSKERETVKLLPFDS